MKGTSTNSLIQTSSIFHLDVLISMLDGTSTKHNFIIYFSSLEGPIEHMHSLLGAVKRHELKSIELILRLKNDRNYYFDGNDASKFVHFLKTFTHVEAFKICSNIEGALKINYDALHKIGRYVNDNPSIIYAEYPHAPQQMFQMLAFRRYKIPVDAYYHVSIHYSFPKHGEWSCSISNKHCLQKGFIQDMIHLFDTKFTDKELEKVSDVQISINIESGLEIVISKEDCENMKALLSRFPNATGFEIRHEHEASILYNLRFEKPRAIDSAVISHPSIFHAKYEGIINSVACRLQDKELLSNMQTR
ncbi:MAG: hypothetical protein ACK5WS_01975 [Alphaproteobacteria bacterium]|jgi:hypothetical protein|nr:hypothetical protein [Candidatus Jidaibacter sp.]